MEMRRNDLGGEKTRKRCNAGRKQKTEDEGEAGETRARMGRIDRRGDIDGMNG